MAPGFQVMACANRARASYRLFMVNSRNARSTFLHVGRQTRNAFWMILDTITVLRFMAKDDLG